jgi:hypothetical protein
MSALPKLDDDGLIRIPKQIRDAAGFQTGDSIRFTVIGPGEVALTTCPTDYNDDACRHSTTPGETNGSGSPGEEATDWDSAEFPKLSLDEFLAKYGPGEPIDDWNAFREAAEAEQGDEFVRRMRAGLE